MSRKRWIAYAGIALIAGLYAYDNGNKSVTLVPANVITVDAITPDEGPDTWRVMFELSDRNEYASEPLGTKPDLDAGDPVCISMEERSWGPSTYHLTAETICWDGAKTPLRAPD